MNSLRRLSRKMQQDWDARGLKNVFGFIASGREGWTESEFMESGQQAVQNFVLTDMENICHGKDPKKLKVLEVGCGAGRVTRALANVFGEVHGIDVSGEMIREAKRLLASTPNA